MAHAEVNGFRMYYEVRGQGEPVICSTGWGLTTGSAYQKLPEQLRSRYQLVVYDHRGLGQSTDSEAPGSTGLYADDVVGLMDHLQIERAHVLGRGGLGACVMQEVAINHPQRVHDLVLASGWGRHDPHHHAADEMFATLLEKVGFEAFQLYGGLICYLPEYFNAHKDRILGPTGGWSDIRDRRDAHLKLIRATLIHDAWERLPHISAPTLLIHAEKDFLGGPRFGRELQSQIPDSELVILEGAPHVIASVPEAHAKFGQVTADWFARHPLELREAVRA